MATYQYSIAELAKGQRPASAPAGQPYDYLGLYATLALAERVEALVAEVAAMNGHLAALVSMPAKLDALVEATKSKTAL